MNDVRPRLGIVEDNADLLEELLFFLEGQGYAAWGVGSAEALWRTLHTRPVDIMLVDLGLPGEDGFGVIEYLRQLSGFGIIIITARGGTDDRLRGLGLGADKYHIKPVNFAQLTEDIEALWQRMQASGRARGGAAPMEEGWVLDALGSCLVDPEGRRLPLTPQELAFIEVLYGAPGEVQSKTRVHERLFGPGMGEADTHRVDVILSRLRRKAVQRRFQLPVRTMFGRGLVFSPSRSGQTEDARDSRESRLI
ncbi:MAG: response regulator transcription factor [Pigmentiphaga sp.]|nr:response regulator transcription factor [Pigmentiphaga sp.]